MKSQPLGEAFSGHLAFMLAWQRYGEQQSGIPLIFLHGMLGERHNWHSQAESFAKEYPVITVDLRNHGESPHVKGMGYRQMADDVLALMAHLNIPEAMFCGHSMGGKVAMFLALQTPERVSKLAVVDIAPVKYPLWHQPLLQALLALPIERLQSRKQADEYLAHRIDDPFERAFLLKNLQRVTGVGKGFQWKCNLREIARQYLNIAGFPELAKSYSGETLFIRGSDSNYVTDEAEAPIKQYFPQAHIATIAGAGHLPHVQQPVLFSMQLDNFLKDTRHSVL